MIQRDVTGLSPACIALSRCETAVEILTLMRDIARRSSSAPTLAAADREAFVQLLSEKLPACFDRLVLLDHLVVICNFLYDLWGRPNIFYVLENYISYYYRGLMGYPLDHEVRDGRQVVDCLGEAVRFLTGVIWHHWQNYRNAVRRFESLVTTPMLARLDQAYGNRPLPSRPDDGVVTICYVEVNLTPSSSYANCRNILSLVEAHVARQTPGVRVVIYARGSVEPGVAAWCAANNIRLRRFTAQGPTAEHCAEMAVAAGEDAVDVLFLNSYDLMTGMLAYSGLAPRVLYASMGFAPFKARVIDRYLIVRGEEVVMAEAGIPSSRSMAVPYYLGAQYLIHPPAASALDQARSHLPLAGRVLGTLCRLEKVSDAFLDCVTRILSRRPDAIMLICGRGDQEAIRHRLLARPGGDRVILPGPVDRQVYHWLFDVYLETFPFVQGMSVVEAQWTGRPVVHMDHEGKPDYIRPLRDPALMARTLAEYVDLVGRLLDDSAFYEARSAEARRLVAEVPNVAAVAARLEDWALNGDGV